MRPQVKKTSIKDIARLARVSVATVSRIINQNGRYSEATKQRVLQIMAAQGYTLNAIAKSLRTNKTNCLGVIVPDITNEFFARVVKAVEDCAIKHNYSVFVCNTDENVERETQQLRKLQEQSVDGLIYISGKANHNINQNMAKPVVYVDRQPAAAGTFILSDNLTGGYLATEELINKGCKRILFLRDSRKLSPVINRENGYKKALRNHHLPFDKKWIVNVKNVTYADAREAVRDAIKRNLRFDGVFATSDWMALGAVHALEEQRLRIPEDVKVVGFDNISIATFSYPTISSIHQDTRAMGRVAVEQLLQLIEHPGSPNKVILIPVRLESRTSSK